MWTALTGTLEKVQQQQHHHHHYHHHRPPHYYNNLREPSTCGPIQVMSIPRRQRQVFKALVAVLVVLFVGIVLPLVSLRSSGGITSRSERIALKMHQLKDFFVAPENSRLEISSASSAADAQAEDAESMAAAAAATELLTVDSIPDVPRRRLTEEEEEDGKVFAPLEQGNGNQEGDKNNGDMTNDDNKENERDSNNGNDNSNSESGGSNNALSLSLMLSMWTDQKEEHSLPVRLAVQRALRDILCQSNEVVVLSLPGSNSDSSNERSADTATNVCLAGGGGTNRQLNAAQTHRAAAWEDASANGYYTVLESSPTILQRGEQVSYIPYQVWTINFPVLNMGALYKNQVSTNQQYLESSSSGSNNATDGAADDVVASDGAIQMAALSIFAGEIQRKLDRLLASGSFEATMNLYALGATSHSSVVGNEYETFSKVVPAPLHPITAFFNKTFDEWTWDPIHIACVALLGSLVIGMTVLMCLLCRRRKFKVAYPNNLAAAKRGGAFDKNYHSGSSTGNDETLSVGFPDALGAGAGSVRKIQGSDDGSVHSLYAASLPPMDTVSLAQSDSRMEEGLPADDVFDPAVYAYLDAEQHYAQASAVDEDDLRGGWGSCLIPLPGSLRKQKSASSTKTKGSSQSKSSKAAAEVGTGILRPPSYSTSGPVDVDEARNNQSALEAYGDSKDDEDRNGWSSSSSCTSEGVTLAYETDLDATVEIDMDTGYRLNKRMKKVAFKYVETNRSMSPDRQCLGGERDVDIDDGLISDLDDEGSFCSLYGGAAAFRESSSSVIRRKSLSGGDAVDTVKEGASVPVDIDSLLTADQVGMMPTEIGTCATLGLSTEAEDKTAENKGMDPTSSDDNNVAPLATLGQSVRKAASILVLKR